MKSQRDKDRDAMVHVPPGIMREAGRILGPGKHDASEVMAIVRSIYQEMEAEDDEREAHDEWLDQLEDERKWLERHQ